MKIRLLNLSCLVILLLTSCAAPVTESQQPTINQPGILLTASLTPTPLPTITSTSTYIITNTSTPLPTRTRRPTMTPGPIMTDAPTLTSSPQPPAKCPIITPGPTPTVIPHERGELWYYSEEDFLSFLNDYYSPQMVIKQYGQGFLKDLTNDGVPELIISNSVSLFIFTCNEGQWNTLSTFPPDAYLHPPHIINIGDNNKNGFPELFLNGGEMSQGGNFYWIFEWDGNTFRNLINNVNSQSGISDDEIEVEISGKAVMKDIDQDGMQEIIANTGLPLSSGEVERYGLPWRSIHQVFHWDGQYYSLRQEDYTPPQYRFQAVQDGDRKSLSAEYDKALAFYQDAIFSNKLDWWTVEKHDYFQAVWDNTWRSTPMNILTLLLIPAIVLCCFT
jgi:hypothetical protein